MKFLPALIIFLLPLLNPLSGNKLQQENTWTKEELRMANTAGNASYLTGEEKDIVIYMNLARMNGEKFLNTYFQDFANTYNKQMLQYSNYKELQIDRNDRYYRSLEKDLKKIKNLPMLRPDQALSLISKQHAADMNKNKFRGHTSSDGRTVKDRIGSIYPKRSNGETLAFGFSSGLGNVCMLLLDKDVPDLGHRKIILDTSYKLNYVGISIQPHKKYKYSAVIDFVSLPQ